MIAPRIAERPRRGGRDVRWEATDANQCFWSLRTPDSFEPRMPVQCEGDTTWSAADLSASGQYEVRFWAEGPGGECETPVATFRQ